MNEKKKQKQWQTQPERNADAPNCQSPWSCWITTQAISLRMPAEKNCLIRRVDLGAWRCRQQIVAVFFFTHPYHSIFRWLPYNSNKTMYNMKLSITYCKLCWLSRDKQGEYKSVTSGTASVVSEHWEGWNIVPPLCFSFMPCYLRYILERCWKFVLTDTWGWNWNWSCDCGMAVLVLEFQLRHFGEWQVEMCVDFIQWRDFWIW